jgi:tRNA pseudouridine55 synthase
MEDQIILIDKPAGISSFGVVAKVRGRLKAEFGHKVKVGHTGTLDPFATGLLILLSGKMTKKSNEFLKLDKIYEATLKLGYTSSTGDLEGEILQYNTWAGGGAGGSPAARRRKPSTVGETATTGPAQSAVQSTINNFLGKITQTPPKFSAIKINGQRAYKLARAGKDFEIPSRQIEIYSIEILDYNYPKLKIKVHCSSGTYIRTLAEDIGKKLNTGAYLTALRRTKIGDYDIKDAKQLVL